MLVECCLSIRNVSDIMSRQISNFEIFFTRCTHNDPLQSIGFAF